MKEGMVGYFFGFCKKNGGGAPESDRHLQDACRPRQGNNASVPFATFTAGRTFRICVSGRLQADPMVQTIDTVHADLLPGPRTGLLDIHAMVDNGNRSV